MEPKSVAEMIDAVAAAAKDKTSLEVIGGGTRGVGRPVNADRNLSTAGLTGISLYEPRELVISAYAGTPYAEIEAVLRENAQMLPFEPMDHRLLSRAKGAPTIGGVVAANISGPRRVSAGAARDHLIGVKLVNGRGEPVKSGGRVMKNVTGLDLVKLICGSHGTLGVLTEVTFKLLPASRYSASVIIDGLSAGDAVRAMGAALGSPYDVSSAAHLPATNTQMARTLLRLEGFETSVTYRAEQISDLLSGFGDAALLTGVPHTDLWRGVADCAPLAGLDQNIWRLSISAPKAITVMQDLDPEGGLPHYFDWGGGLVWLATPKNDLNIGHRLHALAAQYAGHATLIRADDNFRQQAAVFQPLSEPVMALTRGIKDSFDPHQIFNFGRMYRNI